MKLENANIRVEKGTDTEVFVQCDDPYVNFVFHPKDTDLKSGIYTIEFTQAEKIVKK